MQIFIGGSSERKDLMSEVASWIGPLTDQQVLRWDMEEAFPLGGSTWGSLVDIANRVHGAVFIMTPDDLTWHRGSLLEKARDNVILEYGLFTGILGGSRVIMCVDSDTDLASDVKGITYAYLKNADSGVTSPFAQNCTLSAPGKALAVTTSTIIGPGPHCNAPQ